MIENMDKGKRKFIKIPVIIIVAFIFGNGMLMDKPSPFAAAFMASLTGFDCIYAFVGTVLGFTLRGELSSAVSNLIVLTFIGIFRILIAKNYNKFINFATILVCGLSVLTTNVLTSSRPGDIFVSLVFALASSLGVYSFITCYGLFDGRHYLTLLKPANVAALGISYCIFIMSLSSFEYSALNLGLLAAVLISIVASQKYRYAGGVITGAIAALGISIADTSYLAGGLMIAIAALGGSLFARLGKITAAAGYILISGICVMLLGANEYTMKTMANILMGAVVFAFLPADRILAGIKYAPTAKSGTDVSEIFAERLKMSASALKEVKIAVEKTAEILDQKNRRDISWVYNNACNDICRKCRFNMKCWGEEYDDTVKVFGRIMLKMRGGGIAIADDLDGTLYHRCIKREGLILAINTRYKEFVSSNINCRKISEMRTILTAQLSATESMILEMAGEFTECEKFDRQKAAEIENLLASLGAKNVRAAVFFLNGRASAEVYGKGTIAADEEKLCDRISEALKIEFDLPEILYIENEFRITMYERAVFSIEYGASQLSKAGEQNCGDYYDSFIDSKGFAYIVLSDGMGSGGRARIDSAFACGMLIKLLRCSISLSSAIEIINNSLLVKSSDESFATLDICRIDLYSGQVELYKAGGAPTYIRHDKRLIKAKGQGIPVGISSKANYNLQRFNIGNSDIIIMTSDGAELNEKWLEHELLDSDKNSGGMEAVAQGIANAAKYSAEKGKGDDISVIAVKLVK
ncbi:MAG: SpoIIE family protein phosphatase [Eubacterium sp.]|jgi:stage II sporulation protein E|nr:SpoIIE family protein phosphatase [Eubacterium sp.]